MANNNMFWNIVTSGYLLKFQWASERILPGKIPKPDKKKRRTPSLPGSYGFINAHVVLIMQGFVICWFQIKCIVFHKYRNANCFWHILLILLLMASTCVRSWWKDLPHFHFKESHLVYRLWTLSLWFGKMVRGVLFAHFLYSVLSLLQSVLLT